MEKKYTIGYVNHKKTVKALFVGVTESELLVFKQEIVEADKRDSASRMNDKKKNEEWSMEIHDNFYETSLFRSYSYNYLYNEIFHKKDDLVLLEELSLDIL